MTAVTTRRGVRPKEGAEILGTSLPTFYRYQKQHDDFPRAMRLSARCTVFDEAELIAWRESRKVKTAETKSAVSRDEAAWKRAMIDRRACVAKGGA